MISDGNEIKNLKKSIKADLKENFFESSNAFAFLYSEICFQNPRVVPKMVHIFTEPSPKREISQPNTTCATSCDLKKISDFSW